MMKSLMSTMNGASPGIVSEWVGVVLDVDDPLKSQRVRVEIPGVFEASSLDVLPWLQVDPPSNLGGSGDNYGGVSVPAKGSIVRVHFPIKNGQPDRSNGRIVSAIPAPLDVWGLPDELKMNYPHRVGAVTPSGVLWFIDNSTGEVFLRTRHGTGFQIDAEGNVNICAKDRDLNILAKNVNIVADNEFNVKAGTLTEDVTGTATRAASAHLIKGDTAIDGEVTGSSDASFAGVVSASDGVFSGKSFIAHKHIAKGLTSPPI